MNKQQSSSDKSVALHPYAGLLHELEELRSELKELEQLSATTLQHTNPLHRASTINLIHYLVSVRKPLFLKTSRSEFFSPCPTDFDFN
jgi:hypothetical protein